jgi:flagellar protein FlgJ
MPGILDYAFNPQLYRTGGGILDLINSVQGMPQITPSAGFPGAPASAPAPAQPPAPTGEAALPPNAQPAVGQLPPPAAAEPGIGDRLLTGFQSFAGSRGLIPALVNGIAGTVTGERQDPAGQAMKSANQTAQFLVTKGMDPSLAKTVASNPQLMQAVLPQYMGLTGKTDDIKEFEYARQEDPSLTFQKFMSQKKAVSGEYSLTPQYGTNDKGETVLIQTGKSGEAIQTKLPAGVKISSGVDKVDLGTQWGIIDKRTGNLIGTQPKDLAGAEKAKEVGSAQGQAQAKIPAALIDAESTSKKIDELLASPGLNSIVGAFDQYRPSWTLGDAGRNALARLEQLQGGAFLQAFNTLKGGGAITEAEGRKAEQAIARMQRSQGEGDFRLALQDFRDAVNDGIKKLRASAGESGSFPPSLGAPAAAAPATNLRAKYGLN